MIEYDVLDSLSLVLGQKKAIFFLLRNPLTYIVGSPTAIKISLVILAVT